MTPPPRHCPPPNVCKVQWSVLLSSRRLNVEKLRSSTGRLSSSQVEGKCRQQVTGLYYQYDLCCWRAPRISAAPAQLCLSHCVPLGSEPQNHPGRTTLQTAKQHKQTAKSLSNILTLLKWGKNPDAMEIKKTAWIEKLQKWVWLKKKSRQKTEQDLLRRAEQWWRHGVPLPSSRGSWWKREFKLRNTQFEWKHWKDTFAISHMYLYFQIYSFIFLEQLNDGAYAAQACAAAGSRPCSASALGCGGHRWRCPPAAWSIWGLPWNSG